MRYFFEISYKGTNYNGWQSQPNAIGVQAVVEDCLMKLIRQSIAIVGSGRTDTGVHCEQQFFHADFDDELPENFLFKFNNILPKDIAIHSIKRVTDEANARYSAIRRSYQYRIVREKDVFAPGFALLYYKPLDVKTMSTASALLLGKHDFKCFSKVKTDVNNFICEITRAEWHEDGNKLTFNISANRFLRGMVRAIVGTLLDVGSGKIDVNVFREIISSKDRSEAGANVLPCGLYLTEVIYPEQIFINE